MDNTPLIPEELAAQLPDTPTAQGLILLIGYDAFAELSREMGACRLHIHPNPGQHHPIAVCVGLDAARKMGHVWGGMSFDVPIAEGIYASIKRLKAEGLNNIAIARKLYCTRRTVQRVLKATEKDHQATLFD